MWTHWRFEVSGPQGSAKNKAAQPSCRCDSSDGAIGKADRVAERLRAGMDSGEGLIGSDMTFVSRIIMNQSSPAQPDLHHAENQPLPRPDCAQSQPEQTPYALEDASHFQEGGGLLRLYCGHVARHVA